MGAIKGRQLPNDMEVTHSSGDEQFLIFNCQGDIITAIVLLEIVVHHFPGINYVNGGKKGRALLE